MARSSTTAPLAKGTLPVTASCAMSAWIRPESSLPSAMVATFSDAPEPSPESLQAPDSSPGTALLHPPAISPDGSAVRRCYTSTGCRSHGFISRPVSRDNRDSQRLPLHDWSSQDLVDSSCVRCPPRACRAAPASRERSPSGPPAEDPAPATSSASSMSGPVPHAVRDGQLLGI